MELSALHFELCPDPHHPRTVERPFQWAHVSNFRVKAQFLNVAPADETVSDAKTPCEQYWERAEIADKESAKEILEQMDTILYFVSHLSFRSTTG